MKSYLIATSVIGILLLGTVAWVTLTGDDVATAQTTIGDDVVGTPSVVETPSTLGPLSMISDDTTIGSLVDTALFALQGFGVLPPDAAKHIKAAIDDSSFDLNTVTVGDTKARIAELDWDSIIATLTKEHHRGLTDHPAPSDGGSLHERFHEQFRERFHKKWFERGQQEFSFGDFEFPEGFDLGQLITMGDLFKELGLSELGLSDLDLGDLMEAFRNGDFDEFLGSDTNDLAGRRGAWHRKS